MDIIDMLQIKQIPRKLYHFYSEKKYVLMNLDLEVYWLWVVLRIFFTIMPQTGYIHPDEYFQTVEVLAGKAFDTDVNIPWEFNATFPIRSIPAIYLTIYIPLCTLKTISDLFESMTGVSLLNHYFILVVPRLAMCALSFVSDICLFKISYCFGQNYKERLIIYASSFVTLVFMTRTFTNSIEMMCFNVLLCLVSLTIADSEGTSFQNSFLAERLNEASTVPDKVRIKKLLRLVPQHTLKSCLPIAIVTVTGFFNRPTFLVFAFIPLFYWFQRGLTIRSAFLKEFHIRIFIFCLYCIPVIAFFVYFDSVFYGYITWGEILNFDLGFKNFVFTPLNFIMYNLDVKNLAQHGVHPRFLHVLVNIPLLFNVLGLSGLVVLIKLFYRGFFSHWTLLPRSQSVTAMMTLSFLFPVLVLSIVPHQEPRFITPILLPLIFLYAHLIRDFDEDCEAMVPFRKRFPEHIDFPASGVLRFPYKCFVFLKDATANLDNRYYISSRYLAEMREQEIMAMRNIDGRYSPPTDDTKSKEKPKKGLDLIKVWCMFNILCIIFFGFLHQGGMFGLTRDMHNRLAVKPRYTTYHLVTSHVYSFPVHLLNLKKNYKSKNTNFTLYELGSDKPEKFHQKLETILKMAEATKKSARRKYRLFVSLPTSVFNEYMAESRGNYTFKIIKSYHPHISTEAVPSFLPEKIPYEFHDRFGLSDLLDIRPLSYVFQWLHHFSLLLIEIKVPE